MKEFTVNANDAGQRLDKFALKVTLSLPKSLLYKAVRTKKIKVNRKRCEAGQFLAEGDTVGITARSLARARSITEVTHRISVAENYVCKIALLVRNDNGNDAGTYIRELHVCTL